jgi:hypothetical protein
MKRAVLWLAVSSEEQARDDKISIEQQERDLRAAADRFNWHITDVLTVPGFSRVFYNFPEFASAAAAAGYDAGLRLLDHWKRRNFDVLAYRDGSRIGREQSILSEAVIRTIDTGASIYDLMYGWVDTNNYRMYASMVPFGAATDIDKLKKFHRDGMAARAQRGLAMTSQVSLVHQIVRDDRGRAVGLIVDESKRRLLDDVATLLLEGVAWSGFEQVLHERFGHLADDGYPYTRNFFYNLLHRPSFWGHSVRNQATSGHRYGQQWAYDTTQTPPDGILMIRNTHEPAYNGDQAALVQAELKRRKHIGKGKVRPDKVHLFTGLIACGVCGHNLRYVTGKGGAGYYCDQRIVYKNHTVCSVRNYISVSRLKAWFDIRLQPLMDGVVDRLQPEATSTDLLTSRLDTLRTELLDTEARARALIQKQITAPEALSDLYDEQLEALGRRLGELRNQLDAAQIALESEHHTTSQQAVQHLRELGTTDVLWQQDENTINQILHALLNGWVLYVVPGEAAVLAPRKKRTSWR